MTMVSDPHPTPFAMNFIFYQTSNFADAMILIEQLQSHESK